MSRLFVWSSLRPHNPFKFNLRVVSKVDKITDRQARCFEIVMNLCAVFGGKLCYGLQFEDDLLKAD